MFDTVDLYSLSFCRMAYDMIMGFYISEQRNTCMNEASTKSRPEGYEGFTGWLRWIFRDLIEGMGKALVKINVGPNTITVIGLLFSLAAAFLAALGRFPGSGLVYLLGVPLDALDGAVARAGGKVTSFGAFLDSTLDRYGEFLILGGVAYQLSTTGNTTGVMLVMVALFGSVMVSYTRARSEGLGIQNKVGLFTRVERFMILTLTLLLNQVMIGLWLLAVFSHVTVIQRMIRVYQGAERERQE